MNEIVVAIIFLIFRWRKVVGPLERMGWVGTIVLVFISLSPVPIEGVFPKTIVFLGALVSLLIAALLRDGKEEAIPVPHYTETDFFVSRINGHKKP